MRKNGDPLRVRTDARVDLTSVVAYEKAYDALHRAASRCRDCRLEITATFERHSRRKRVAMQVWFVRYAVHGNIKRDLTRLVAEALERARVVPLGRVELGAPGRRIDAPEACTKHGGVPCDSCFPRLVA